MIPHMKAKVVFIGKKIKTNFFFEKRKSKWLTKKKLIFQLCLEVTPILNIFLQKCHGLVLWLVGLIDAKGIGVAQPIWL